jgi:hypothetical protein
MPTRSPTPRGKPSSPTGLQAAVDLISLARLGLASTVGVEADSRYATAHLAALRSAAAVLAVRARPVGIVAQRRPRAVWELLPQVAPEFGEWAAFFATGAGRLSAVRAREPVSNREADDLVRDVETFLADVESRVLVAYGDPPTRYAVGDSVRR